MKSINLALLARLIQARANSLINKNQEWVDKHTIYIDEILKALPSGSGIDAGMHIDYDRSNSQKIVFTFSWHHMDEHGYYDGWSHHELIIRPTFGDKDLRITGKRLSNIKDHLYDMFDSIFAVTTPSETQNESMALHKKLNPEPSN